MIILKSTLKANNHEQAKVYKSIRFLASISRSVFT